MFSTFSASESKIVHNANVLYTESYIQMSMKFVYVVDCQTEMNRICIKHTVKFEKTCLKLWSTTQYMLITELVCSTNNYLNMHVYGSATASLTLHSTTRTTRIINIAIRTLEFIAWTIISIRPITPSAVGSYIWCYSID